MDRRELYRRALKWAGCRYQLSLALNIPRQSVYQWQDGIPRRHVAVLVERMMTPWVPPHEIRPSLRRKQPNRSGATK